MRRSFTAVAFLIALTIELPGAWAAGNVLLPSDDPSSPPPSLGLGAPSAAPAAPVPSVPAPPALAPAMPPAATTMPDQPASTYTTSTPTITPPPASSQVVITPIDAASAAGLPPGTIPTQVIQEPDMSKSMGSANGNLPRSLTIAIGPKSMFGAEDVQTLTGRLGLRREQIPAACVLTPRGVMQTTKGDYIITGGASPQTVTGYDGDIKDYIMTTTALCVVANKLPPGSGILEKIGDRFSIGLQSIQCPPPVRAASQLTITYNGSDTAQCTYQ